VIGAVDFARSGSPFGQGEKLFPVSSYVSAVVSIDNAVKNLGLASQSLIASLGSPPSPTVVAANSQLAMAAGTYGQGVKTALQSCKNAIFTDFQKLSDDALALREAPAEPAITQARVKFLQDQLDAQKIVAALSANAQMGITALTEAGTHLTSAIPATGRSNDAGVIAAFAESRTLLPAAPMPAVPPFSPCACDHRSREIGEET